MSTNGPKTPGLGHSTWISPWILDFQRSQTTSGLPGKNVGVVLEIFTKLCLSSGLKMVFSVWFEISNSRPAQQDTDDLLGAWQGSVVLFLPKHRVLKRKCKHHNRRPAQSADHPYDWSTGLHFTTSGDNPITPEKAN